MSSEATVGVADNGDVGRIAVDAACSRWPLVSTGEEGPGWFDAEFTVDLEGDLAGVIVTQGTPVEVKTCLLAYDDPSGRRHGRWWIKRCNHEQLLANDGEYVLSVHDSSGEVLRQALVGATTVDAIVDGNWWMAGNGGDDAEEYRQIPWPTVFNDLGGETA